MDVVRFLLVGLTWGCSFILMKKASVCFGPLAVAGWRCMAGVAGLMVWYGLRRSRRKPGRWAPGAMSILIIFSYLWPYAIQPIMVKHLDSGFTSIMVSFVPIFTIVVSMPMLKTYPSRRQLLGVLGGLLCMVVLFYDKMQTLPSIWHLLLAATVPLSYAIGNSWNKVSFNDMDPMLLAIRSMFLAGLILLPVSAGAETVRVDSNFGLAVWSILILGVIGTGIALGLFYVLIQTRGPLFAGMVTYVIPLGGVLLGAMDGERVSVMQLVALFGVLVCVGVTQFRGVDRSKNECSSAGNI